MSARIMQKNRIIVICDIKRQLVICKILSLLTRNRQFPEEQEKQFLEWKERETEQSDLAKR